MADPVRIARVLNEDDDFILLEVAKKEDVVFHLQQDENGETVGGDRFFTMTETPDGVILVPWTPWET